MASYTRYFMSVAQDEFWSIVKPEILGDVPFRSPDERDSYASSEGDLPWPIVETTFFTDLFTDTVAFKATSKAKATFFKVPFYYHHFYISQDSDEVKQTIALAEKFEARLCQLFPNANILKVDDIVEEEYAGKCEDYYWVEDRELCYKFIPWVFSRFEVGRPSLFKLIQ